MVVGKPLPQTVGEFTVTVGLALTVKVPAPEALAQLLASVTMTL
jgi:hypothetical protein